MIEFVFDGLMCGREREREKEKMIECMNVCERQKEKRNDGMYACVWETERKTYVKEREFHDRICVWWYHVWMEWMRETLCLNVREKAQISCDSCRALCQKNLCAQTIPIYKCTKKINNI